MKMRARKTPLAKALVATLLVTGIGAANADTQQYTLDGEFDAGALDGVNHDVVNDQLQLNETGTTFPVMWIANAGEDTVSKIDTVNNCELARYRTEFGDESFTNHSAWGGAAPSRTAVDIDGNVYVANRNFDNTQIEIFKILAEGGIDRDGSGFIDTSDGGVDCVVQVDETFPIIDGNADGVIQDDEIGDERIAWVSRFGPTNGLGRSLCIGTDGHLWAGDYNNRTYTKISSADGSVLAGPIAAGASPYGCLVDADGILWSATLGSALIELDTIAETPGVTYVGSSNYGIALGNDKVYLGRGNQEFDPATNTFSAMGGPTTLGIGVDGDGNIIYGSSSIRKIAPDFTVLWDVANPNPGDIRGVIVDSDNNIWLNNLSNSNVTKLDGQTGAFLFTLPVGNSPYTYSDATGFAARNVTSPTGTWTVIKDTGGAGTELQSVSWTADVPTDASIEVEVRVADSEAGLPVVTYQAATNGAAIAGVTGQFVQVRARLTANGDDESPELFDLTIEFGGEVSNGPPTVTGNGPFDVDEGGDVVVSATASDPDGDALTWEWFVDENNDGVVDAGDTLFSTDESPTYSGGIDGPATHQLLVRVSDPSGATATGTVTVNVLNNEPPTVTGNGPFDVNEGSNVVVSATASDPEGDALTWEWFVDENNDGVVDAGDTLFSSDASPTYSGGIDGPDTHQLLVRVSDSGGETATDTVTVNVLNVDPVITEVTGEPVEPVSEDEEVVLEVIVDDPGAPDTHQYSWDWGDGSDPTTDANGTHSYSTPGTYTVTVTVTDDDGGSVSYSFEIVVLLSATRTQGFWRTHGGNGGYTCHVLDTHLGGSIDLGWQTLNSCEDVAGAMWAKIARESDKGKRSSKSCKAKINPSWQLTAAILNTGLDNNAVVPIDPVTGKNIIEAAQDIFTAGTVREIRRIGGLLDAYNNSKDDRKIIDNDGQKVGRANPGGTKKTRTKDILDCP